MSSKETQEIIIDYLAIGKKLEKKGKLEEAIEQYRLAIETNSEVAPYAYYALGNAFNKQNKLTEAKDCYCNSIEKTEIFLYETYIHLGYLLKSQRLFDQALTFFLKAIELNPDLWQAHGHLRGRHWTSIQAENIISSLKKILEFNPDSSFIYLTLGMSLASIGKLEEASSYLQRGSNKKVSKLKPNFTIIEENSGIRKNLDFIIIGSPKAGTSSLYQYMVQHPKILPSLMKEIAFFNSYTYSHGINWYLSHFPKISEEQEFLTGEATPSYLHRPDVPERLSKYFPDLKLIVILRNPIERTISQYYHSVKVEGERRSLAEVIDSEIKTISDISEPAEIINTIYDFDLKYLGWSLYYVFLEKWMHIFPVENFLILNSSDFYAQTPEVMNQVFDFLKLQDHKMDKYHKYLRGSYNFSNNELKNKLSEFFKPYNQKLEEYLDREFNWY